MSGAAVSWLSKKQPVVALSTTEAEYIALCTAAQEATWLRRLLTDIKAPPVRSIVIKEDNQSANAIAKNSVSHARTKHIDVKIHFVREALSNGSIELTYCPTVSFNILLCIAQSTLAYVHTLGNIGQSRTWLSEVLDQTSAQHSASVLHHHY